MACWQEEVVLHAYTLSYGQELGLIVRRQRWD